MSEEMQNQQVESTRTSGLAIASLVLGILGLCTCVTSLPGLILGIIALVQTGKDPRLKGQGIALAGTIISGLAVLVTPILAAILFPVFARAKETAQQTVCLNNVRQLSQAAKMYSMDWDNSYPLAENWNEALAKYAKPGASSSSSNNKGLPWVCPAAGGPDPSYALNAKLAGESDSVVVEPPNTVLIFESQPGKNRAGGAELLPAKPRHMAGQVIGFADGHATAIDSQAMSKLIFDPTAVPRGQ